MMTRDEHLAWCKERALVFVDAGNLPGALATMTSAMNEHPETAPSAHTVAELGVAYILAGRLDTPGQMRDYIEDVK